MTRPERATDGVDGHPPAEVRAAVTLAAGATELRTVAVGELPPDAGLLRLEAAGICGSDVHAYRSSRGWPRVLGHENVGTIAWLGPLAGERWGVAVGDRVLLEEYLPCGSCARCREGNFRSCYATDASANQGALRYGSTRIDVEPGLWGGYAEYLYLHPRSVLHRVPPEIPPREAVLTLPISNGIQWAGLDGQAGPGQAVVVLGPGQQGLGCVIGAREAGAAHVVVAGLARDGERLALARELGADRTVDVEHEDLVEVVRERTGGEMADLVVDTAAGNDQTVAAALEVLKKHGRLLLPTGASEGLTNFPIARLSRRCLTLRGVRGHSYRAVELALSVIASGRYPVHRLSTHCFGLADVDRALRTAAGEDGEAAIHVTVDPWLRGADGETAAAIPTGKGG